MKPEREGIGDTEEAMEDGRSRLIDGVFSGEWDDHFSLDWMTHR